MISLLHQICPLINKLLVFKFSIICVTLSTWNPSPVTGILTSRIVTNGHQNGPLIPESPVQYLTDANIIRSLPLTQLSPHDLSAIGSVNYFQSDVNSNQQFVPLNGQIGQTIAQHILRTYAVEDDDSVEEEAAEEPDERDEEVKKTKLSTKDLKNILSGEDIPKGTVLVYRNQEEEGDGVEEEIAEEEILAKLKESGIIGKVNDQESEADDEDDNGESGDSTGGADEGSTDTIETAKPDRVVIKRIVKGKDGQLTAIDWIEDRGHKKHGWKNLYHKEEWGDTQSKSDLLKDQGWRKRFTDDEEGDLTDQISFKKKKDRSHKKKKRKRKSRSERREKKRKAEDDETIEQTFDDQQDQQQYLGDGLRVPQVLWNYLSHNNEQNLPVEEIKISQLSKNKQVT